MDTQHTRNFCVIAHIDHGKSTLADRFLELTETLQDRQMQEQVLDAMDLERERGITIKMAPVTMRWAVDDTAYTLNLIDTPGHVDFAYEVSRALAAVEGAVLLVDATKGVQAQTLAHLQEAQRQNLTIIPVINKIDLPAARVEAVEEEIRALLPDTDTIHAISAKEGEGIADVLNAVVASVPPPRHPGGSSATPYPRALVFDSQYDPYKGVLAYVRVTDGVIRADDEIVFCAHEERASALEVGRFAPELVKRDELSAGAIGYVATGIKEPEVVRVGDTIVVPRETSNTTSYEPLLGYREPTPVVFASIFPSEGSDLALLKDAFAKLKLSDWALTFEPESSDVLGQGFRCGFLGSLHLEIVLERIRREFDISFVATAPSVRYEIERTDGETVVVHSPSQFPDPSVIREIREPWVTLTLFTPDTYLGGVIQLLQSHRGVHKDTQYLRPERVEVVYDMPLAEIISDFYNKLKSVSSGFASLAYGETTYRPGDLVKLSILVAGDSVEALARVVPREQAYEEGRTLVQRLKELLPKQLFAVAVQAAIGGKVIARETVPAMRKDVTGHLYGGDVTRKRKLLEKQKKGKKRMKQQGKVSIPDEVFVKMLRPGTGKK